jgi:glycine oxidase
MAKIDVLGAGIAGLWQALTLTQHGHDVMLRDPAGVPPPQAASSLAGAMLAPYCEGEAGHEPVREWGVESIRIWFETLPDITQNGSLVVALPRDQAELKRFASVTQGHRWIGEDEIAALEPALAGRFSRALFYADEAHVEPVSAVKTLLELAVASGLRISQDPAPSPECDWLVDCRGLAARDQLPQLRGVRGERLVIETRDVALNRPVRMLHPRIPFYIVPWPCQRFMVGATVIESEDSGAATLRSLLDLMSAAYALDPAFGEARVLRIDAGVRPAFPDNLPRVIVRGRRIFVNGLYRHGFLLSPILSRATANYIECGQRLEGMVFEG